MGRAGIEPGVLRLRVRPLSPPRATADPQTKLTSLTTFLLGPALQEQGDEGDVPRRLWHPSRRHAAVRPQPDGEHVLQGPPEGADLYCHSGLGSEPAGACSHHQGSISTFFVLLSFVRVRCLGWSLAVFLPRS